MMDNLVNFSYGVGLEVLVPALFLAYPLTVKFIFLCLLVFWFISFLLYYFGMFVVMPELAFVCLKTSYLIVAAGMYRLIHYYGNQRGLEQGEGKNVSWKAKLFCLTVLVICVEIYYFMGIKL